MKHLISCKIVSCKIGRRRQGPLLMVAVAFLSGAISATSSAQEMSDVEFKATKLSERVYLLEAEPPIAGNLAVFVGEDGILLVDDQMMPLTPKIKAAIAKIQQGKIAFLINSHYHFDHAGGNEALAITFPWTS